MEADISFETPSGVFNEEMTVAGVGRVIEKRAATAPLVVKRGVGGGGIAVKASISGGLGVSSHTVGNFIVKSGIAGSGPIVKLGGAAVLQTGHAA